MANSRKIYKHSRTDYIEAAQKAAANMLDPDNRRPIYFMVLDPYCICHEGYI